MSRSNARVPYVLAIAAGAILWAVGSAVSDRPWRWCVALFAAQFVTMALLSGEIGNLAPLGLIMFGILSLPAIGAAKVTSGMGRKRDA